MGIGLTDDEDANELREAIIELYLAIKIRSIEELNDITDTKIDEEKDKLDKVSGFQVLEYVRTSIEIIMNLKIEDLESEFHKRNRFEPDSHRGLKPTASELSISVKSSNLI